MKESSFQRSTSYEQLRFVDDMNDSGPRELKPLNVMNRSEMWVI